MMGVWRILALVGVALGLGCEGVEAPGIDPPVDRGASRPDAGAVRGPDATPPARVDARTPDASAPDAGAPDADTPDADTPDAAPPDAASPLDRPLADETIYFVLTDRFANGDPANDHGGPEGHITHGGFDPTSRRHWHGGDLRGLQGRLDYLQGFGITALWITPVVAQRAVQRGSGAYHGYWAVDFERVDPHLGDAADLAALIEDAHGRGMKVFLDVVLNHTADLIHFAEGRYDYRPLSQPAYTPLLAPEHATAKAPAWLNDPRHYNNRGNSTFTGESVIYGDFHGLDDLDTRQEAVIEGLNAIFARWIIATGVDGFRVDTVKHVDLPLWPRFSAAMRAAGPPWFTLFGEIWEGDPAAVGRYLTVGQLPSALDFPLQGALRAVVSQGQPPARLAAVFARDDHYLTARGDARELVTFLGNHDMGRFGLFLHQDRPSLPEAEALDRLRLAHALLYFTRGAPAIYYGDEQGFIGDGGNEGARQDMLPSQVIDQAGERQLGTDRTPAADNFQEDHPLRQALFHLGRVRQGRPALRRGVQIERFADAEGPGIYACSRALPEDAVEHLVVVNTAAEPRSARIPTASPGQRLRPIYGQLAATADARGEIELRLPPFGFVALQAEAPMPPGQASAARISGAEVVGAQTERLRLTAEVEGAGPLRVRWSLRLDDGPWRLAGEDFAPPYLLDLDATGWPPLAALTVRAEIGDWALASTITAEHSVRVDRRVVAAVLLEPERLGDWREAFGLALDGRPLSVAPRPGGWRLELPADAAGLLVGLLAHDGSVELSLWPREALLAQLEETPEGPVARLAVPPGRRLRPAGDAAFDEAALYVRGSFNEWMARDRLLPAGPGRRAATVGLSAGDHHYKFADIAWGQTHNFGGPLSLDGLRIGPDSTDLRLTAPAGGDWTVALQAWQDAAGARIWLPAAAPR